MVGSIAAALPRSYAAIATRHVFDYDFDYHYSGPETSLPYLVQRFQEAWHFGKMAASAGGFVYIGQNGFLRALRDNREFEFSFLASRGKRIICYFTGNDIRSLRKMAELERRMGIPNIGTYLPLASPATGTKAYDDRRQALARTADEYADVIFSSAVDQASYLTRKTEPFLYFFPDEKVLDTLEKFDSESPIVVLHAPSSPIIKGTPLVRAAVAELQAEGWDFEYVELSGVQHDEVERHLRRAHIVLNQFYSFLPGVFGIEAMAAGTVVLMSADERHEPDLPAGAGTAWISTKHYEVASRLREVLKMSADERRRVAAAGQSWVREHATASASEARLSAVLANIGKAAA